MFSSVIAFSNLKCMPLGVFKHPLRKLENFLNLFSWQIQLKHFSKYSTENNIDIFDTVQMKKYLIFLASENLDKSYKSENLEVIRLLKDKMKIEEEMKILESMSNENDKDFGQLIESEKTKYLESIQEIKRNLLNCLSPINDENDNRNVELRIEQGIGGEESRIFSEELFQMYINYAKFKNWEHFEDLKSNYVLISGEFVFGHLKYEAGVHRVQRVPETEKTGRTHTSTCSVIVLPQPKPFEIKISEKDLIVEKLKSSGPGGQNVNKRETCVRIKHIPTGIVIENQTERFQNENLKRAISRLKGVLFNIEQNKVIHERKILKKQQAGSSDYTEKIRTYHFADNRVTDHRLNLSSYNLRGFLEGNKELDYFISKVKEFNKKKELLLHVKDILQSEKFREFEKNQSR